MARTLFLLVFATALSLATARAIRRHRRQRLQQHAVAAASKSPTAELPEPCQRCKDAAAGAGVHVEVRVFESELPTAAAAASELGVETSAVTNSLVFEIRTSGQEREPILVLAPGDRRVDPGKLAALLGVAKSKIKSASPEAVLRYSGYAAGGVAPFGHLHKPARTFIEERVFANEEIWCGAGIKPAMLKCTPAQLVQATGGERVELAQD